jgi:beta-xylosidase
VTRPLTKLIAYDKVTLAPGETTTVEFRVPTDVFSFTGRDGRRRVEPGEIELRLGRSSAEIVHETAIHLVGDVRAVDHTRRLHCDIVRTPR